MAKNTTYSLFVGSKKIAEAKEQTIKVPAITTLTRYCRMQYYYRRGNKYFFRGPLSKLTVDALDVKDNLKFLDYYDIVME